GYQGTKGQLSALSPVSGQGDTQPADTTPPIHSRIKGDVLDPEAGRPTVHLFVVPAFELDALWKVLEVLRCARDAEAGAVEVLELIEGFGECFSPSRTAAAFIADLEKVLTVLTLDIPAGRDLTAAFCLDRTPGFDFDATYAQLATVWRSSGINP
ncbi:hypothetical protein, partial [Streptomyces scopuliridis]|uniref:hypothetical protein n=1 Tax=Streptomyces scopuliridis TaxID=452529 RepID=UPI0036998019